MKVKVSNISNVWKPVQHGREEGSNMVVVTQALEEGKIKDVSIKENGTIKLNLNSLQPNKQKWLDVLREGNVLDVNLYLFGRKIVVSKYDTPRLIKKAEEGKKAKDIEEV